MRYLTACLLVLSVLQGASVMAQSNSYLPRKDGHAYGSLDDIKRVHAMHLAGLTRDVAQVPTLLATVAAPPDHFHFFTAVHALARIGGAQAASALEQAQARFDAEKMTQGYTDEEACAYVEVARAHLLADVDVHKQDSPRQQAQARLNTFLAALHLDPTTLNTSVAQDWQCWLRQGGEESTRTQHAIRELADMIYSTRDADLAEATKTAGIDFTVDPGAKYKVQLAPLSSQQRVEWIIKELSTRQVEKEGDINLIQLAADEGNLASRSAAAKLQEMDQHRERYPSLLTKEVGRTNHVGFCFLFRVISGVGDKDQEPVIAHFLNDKEHWISYYAKQAYGSVKMGIPWKSRIGY